VARAAHREPQARAAAAQPQAQGPPPHPGRAGPKRQSESVYAGIVDHDIPRARIAAVELLCLRYLFDDADYLWLTQRVPDEERFLSCNLTIGWPDQTPNSRTLSHDEGVQVLALLQEVFDKTTVSTRPVSSRCRVEDDRFDGWLSFSSFDRANKALGTLHGLLKASGLGMRQWARDLFIPRSRR
jgi:hypothetical protein